MVDLLQSVAPSDNDTLSTTESYFTRTALLEIAERAAATVVDESRAALQETVATLLSEIDGLLNRLQSQGECLLRTLKIIRQEFDMLNHDRSLLEAEWKDIATENAHLRARMTDLTRASGRDLRHP